MHQKANTFNSLSKDNKLLCTQQVWRAVALHGVAAAQLDGEIGRNFGISHKSVQAKRAHVTMAVERAMGEVDAAAAQDNLSSTQVCLVAKHVVAEAGIESGMEPVSISLVASRLKIDEEKLRLVSRRLVAHLQNPDSQPFRVARSVATSKATSSLQVTVGKVLEPITKALSLSSFNLSRKPDQDHLLAMTSMVSRILDEVQLPFELGSAYQLIRKVNRIDKGNGLPSLDAIGKALGVSKTESDQLAATLFENDILVFNTDSAGYRAATLHPTLKLVCAAVESKADLRISAVKVAYADLLRSAN